VSLFLAWHQQSVLCELAPRYRPVLSSNEEVLEEGEVNSKHSRRYSIKVSVFIKKREATFECTQQPFMTFTKFAGKMQLNTNDALHLGSH